MKLVICDDEPAFLRTMEAMLRRYGVQHDRAISVTRFTGPQALLSADLAECDALFLDIDMRGLNGIETARLLRKRYPSLILVFVTGWIEYAPSGYRVEAFRYLLKKDLQQELPRCLGEIEEKLAERRAKFPVTTAEGPTQLLLQRVVYFEGTNRRSVLAHLATDAPNVDCRGKLADFEEQLRDSGFLRIQRGFLVNMQYIQKITNYLAYLKTGETLKVSERRYSQVCKEFLLWKGRQL